MPDQEDAGERGIPPPIHPEGYAMSLCPLLVRFDWDESVGDMVLGESEPDRILLVVPIWSEPEGGMDAHCSKAVIGAALAKYGRCPRSFECSGVASEIVRALRDGYLDVVMPASEVSGLTCLETSEVVGTALALAIAGGDDMPTVTILSPSIADPQSTDFGSQSTGFEAASVMYQEGRRRAYLN